MTYIPSSFKPGDIVETTKEYRTWAENYYISFGQRTQTYSKGLVKSVHVLHHKDTCHPLMDYIILDNGVSAKAEHFKKASFKCPICKKETEILKLNGCAYFSCENIDCNNIRLYDVFTLASMNPKIEKAV